MLEDNTWQMGHTENCKVTHNENCQVTHTENWKMEFTDNLLELTGIQSILKSKTRHAKN